MSEFRASLFGSPTVIWNLFETILVIASLQAALGEVHLGNKAGYGDEESSSDDEE